MATRRQQPNRPQSPRSAPPPGGIVNQQAETKEDPDKPVETQVVETKEDPDKEMPIPETETKDADASDPSSDPVPPTTPTTPSSVLPETDDYYYNAAGQRVCRFGHPVKVNGVRQGNVIVVVEETVQEFRLPGTGEFGHRLLHWRGEILTEEQAKEVVDSL